MEFSQNAPKISVIVPVFNVEKYLRECVDSVLAQTFKDFELILVDDGSPDNSGKICDEYATKDSRVRVFHKANGGVSSARNLGLENVRGEWITFVDPDDWIDAKMYETLYAVAVRGNADFVWCDFVAERGIISQRTDQSAKPDDVVNFIEGILSGRRHGSVCSKLTRAAALREWNIKFSPEIAYCEDLSVSIRLAYRAKHFCHVPEPFYHYRWRENSACSKLKKRAMLVAYDKVLQEISAEIGDDPRFTEILKNARAAQKTQWRRIGMRENGVPVALPLAILGNLVSLCDDFWQKIKTHVRKHALSLLARWFSRGGNVVKITIEPKNKMGGGSGFRVVPATENCVEFPCACRLVSENLFKKVAVSRSREAAIFAFPRNAERLAV